jgi:hypothetical protein
MNAFDRLHAAIFEELERQGRMAVDAVALTQAVMRYIQGKEAVPAQHYVNPRCASGSCDE